MTLEFFYVNVPQRTRSSTLWYVYRVPMMTSSDGSIFRVTGPLCGEFPAHRWIPLTKASDAEIWCFLWSTSEQTNGWGETPSRSLWRHSNGTRMTRSLWYLQQNYLCMQDARSFRSRNCVVSMPLYSASVTAVKYEISCYSGPRYNGTRLYNVYADFDQKDFKRVIPIIAQINNFKYMSRISIHQKQMSSPISLKDTKISENIEHMFLIIPK